MSTEVIQQNNNPLAQPNNVFRLIKFSMPSIITMIFMSLYTIVDGAFVSQFVGTEALSAINITFPLISTLLAIAIMLATGGSAIVAKKMGEGKPLEAKEDFTAITIYGILASLLITILTILFLDPLLTFLGGSKSIFDYGKEYIIYLMPFATFSVLQILFQFFLVTSGKPTLGMIIVILGGIANIIFDYIFIVSFNMGIKGAALATGIGYLIPAVFGLIYFAFMRKGTLYFVKPVYRLKTLSIACLNGSSEMVTNLSTAVTTYLFNVMTLKYVGVDGVAAITIILYSQFFLTSIYLGYSGGIAPIISYNFGNANVSELKKIYKISLYFIGITSLLTFLFANYGTSFLVKIFTGSQNSDVFNLSLTGMKLFSYSYIFIGFNIFASSLFTALENGKVSAKISFLHTFFFIIPAIILLPLAIGTNGIWLSVPLAEALCLIFSFFYLIKYRKIYNY